MAKESAIDKLIDKATIEKNRQAEKATREVKERFLSGEEKGIKKVCLVLMSLGGDVQDC